MSGNPADRLSRREDDRGIGRATVGRWRADEGFTQADDRVAVEEPLELRVAGRGIAVLMRTPGHDRELAAGFLRTEQVIRHRDELLDLLLCRELPAGGAGNVIEAVLAPGVEVSFERLTRNVFSASSCGVCGKATIAAVMQSCRRVRSRAHFEVTMLAALPARLLATQPGFNVTGGLHAAALVAPDGTLEEVREDVGRHNAVDKLIGRALLDDRLPLADSALLVSGRISFELVQKALVAGIPLVAGIGAPSSLAIECAAAGNQTLVGFLRSDRCNIYAAARRVRSAPDAQAAG